MSTLKLSMLPVSLLLLTACGDSGGGESGGSSGGSTGTSTEPTTEPATGADTGTEPTTSGIEGDPALYQACLDYFASFLARPILECECKVANGEYPTVDACVVATGLKYGDVVTCFCESVAQVPASAEYLDCNAAADKQQIDCLEPLACDDIAAQEACTDAHFAATMGCPFSLPDLVHLIEEVQCYGEPAFTCGDDLPIPAYRKCDGHPDCADGSDEQGCP